jgi:hypothetical protein
VRIHSCIARLSATAGSGPAAPGGGHSSGLWSIASVSSEASSGKYTGRRVILFRESRRT